MATPAPRCTLRLATDADSAAVIALIARAYAEYPGNVLDVDAEEPELRRPATSFDRFWVAEAAGAVVGCAGAAVHAGHVEMKKVYVDRPFRGTGVAQALVARFEAFARSHPSRRAELWTDTRFHRAHRFYAKLGYRFTGRTRDLHDLSNTTEYHFVKDLTDAS